MPSPHWCSAAVASFVVSCAGIVHAQSTSAPRRPSPTAEGLDTDRPSCRAPWVAVVFDWSASYARLEASVMADLKAGFSGRDIDVCVASSGPSQPPLAAVTVSSRAVSSEVTIEIRDTLTHKRVSRDIDLRRVPSDGRAFALALAMDELVWASWAELALERRDRPAVTAPPQVKRAFDDELPEPVVGQSSSAAARVALRAAGEVFGGGQRHVGLDAAISLPMTETVRLDLALGMRRGGRVRSESGVVTSDAVGISLGVRYLFVRRSDFELGAAAFGYGAWLNLRGEAHPGAEADAATRPAVFTGGQLLGEWRLSAPLWFGVSAYAAAPVQAVEATDDGNLVTGASGVLLGLQTGVGVDW